MKRRSRVLIASELFHPEQTSTGHVMTSLARGLSTEYEVGVVCAQPTYSARGVRAPRQELLDGQISIRRIRSTTFGKERMAGRLLDMLSITVSTLLELLRTMRVGDVVIVVTNPPALPYMAAVASRLRRAKTVLIVHDMFPEVLAIGLRESPTRKLAIALGHQLSRWLYRSVDVIVVIGPDQAERIEQKMVPGELPKVICVPLPHDEGFDRGIARSESEHFQAELGDHSDKVVFQFAGNMGPLQGGEFLATAVCQERTPLAHFNFVGAGRSRGVFEQLSTRENVTISNWVPRDMAPDLHFGCDVVIVSLVEGMWGISVPSRIGNALAAGKPILGVVDEGSALDRLIVEFDIGWSVRPGDFDAFWSAVEAASCDAELRQRKSAACLKLARTEFAPAVSSARYRSLVGDLVGRAG